MFTDETLAIIGEGDCPYEGAITPPIFETSTFSGGEYSYSRVSNPTRRAFEKAVAKLERGRFGFAFSSGLAAVNSVFSLLSSGDRVIISDDIYGGTYRMIEKIYRKYRIEFISCDMTDPENIKTLIDGNTKMIFAETPTNPLMKIAPIAEISKIARENNFLFVVDNTFLSPYFQKPLTLGADIVIHSATKFISGHHDTVAGVIVTDNESLAEKIGVISMTLGNALSPFESWLALKGLRTLPLRMERVEANSMAVAEFLSSLPEVERVIYPGLESDSGHEACKKQASGFGGVVSFYVRDIAVAEGFKNGGKIIKFAESLGGFRTLITYPITQTHFSVPESVRERLGITDKLFRLSVGLESIEDIKSDIREIIGRKSS